MDITLFFIFFLGWNGIGGICLLGAWAESYSSWIGKTKCWAFVNPFVVYRYNTSVNWFGAIVIALLLTIVCPIGAALYWIYNLGWLFCKLCTIGRR